MDVLVAESHGAVTEQLVQYLQRHRYRTRCVCTGAEALKAHREVDLVLLDLDLPDIDGLEVCQAIRRVSHTPIIAFVGTNRDSEVDRVLALQAGADDCIVRSCGFREVKARIDAVMRRARTTRCAPQTISHDSLHIDARTREVRVDGRRIDTTAKEFELLYFLASNPETVVSRKELIKTVWANTWTGSSRTIDTHVSSLRSKLGASSWIFTVRGVGYRIGHG